MRVFILFCGLLYGLVSFSDACTTFVLQNSTTLVFGRNFDYDLGTGFIVINNRGLRKQAFVQGPYQPARWTAKYGSVTFNQVGIDAPMGGMNEAGLVIAQMALTETKYPKVDKKPVLNQLEWIQYQLDISKSLTEVLENSEKITIVPVATPVHYFICDRQGNKGVVEFLDGKITIISNKELVIPVCSNMIYEKSITELHRYRGFGGQENVPRRWTSLSDIVAIAATEIKTFEKMYNMNPVEYGFKILRKVGSDTRTQWSMVYDIPKRCIYFKTRNNRTKHLVDLNGLDFSCPQNIYVHNLQSAKKENGSIKFTVLTKDTYFNYKKDLVNRLKQRISDFPEIPVDVLRMETEYVFERTCH